MIYTSQDMEKEAILQTAAHMCTAVRTAPKAHGKDTLYTMVLTGEEKDALSKKMEETGLRIMGEKMCTWYGRDAENVRKAQAVVLIGAKCKTRGVPDCGFCGFADCGECTKKGGNCAYLYIDLGIAVSSAVASADINRVDNRVMFSVGRAAGEMNYEDGVLWLGIPLSVSGKNIFFDRGIVHA